MKSSNFEYKREDSSITETLYILEEWIEEDQEI